MLKDEASVTFGIDDHVEVRVDKTLAQVSIAVKFKLDGDWGCVAALEWQLEQLIQTRKVKIILHTDGWLAAGDSFAV